MARFSKTQSCMRVRPRAVAAMSEKKGRLSMLRPGKGIGWILSMGAISSDLISFRSIRRVRPLSARYSGLIFIFWPMLRRISSSISKNSMGTRLTPISDLVTTPAAMKLMASIGSSLGLYSISWAIFFMPRILKVVVPMPSISTPSFWR